MDKIHSTDTTVKLKPNWVFSHSQISLFRLCPARWAARYLYHVETGPEAVSPVMEYSKALLHTPIEDFHGLEQTDENIINLPSDEYWTQQLNIFHKATGIIDDPLFNLKTARDCLQGYINNPLKGNVHLIESPKYVQLDDPITGEKAKYRYVSKPDIVTEDATNDIKITTSEKLYELKKFDDQFVGQAVCWERSRFRRLLFHVVKRTPKGKPAYGKFKGMFVEEWELDPVIADNWLTNTVKTIHDIESCIADRVFVTNDQSCGAFGRPCPYLKDCNFGRI